jgi:hypothetical protein
MHAEQASSIDNDDNFFTEHVALLPPLSEPYDILAVQMKQFNMTDRQ